VATGLAIGRYTPVGSHEDLTPGACANLAPVWVSLPPDPTVGAYVLRLREYPQDPSAGTDRRSLSIEPRWIADNIQQAQMGAGLTTYPYGDAQAPPPPPADPNATNRPFAWGFFDSAYADATGVCTATLNASDLAYPLIPAYVDPTGMPVALLPQVAIRYEWSNVRVVVRGTPIGQELFADLTITMDGCRGQYQVVILYPDIPCFSYSADSGLMENASVCKPNAVPSEILAPQDFADDAGLPATIPIDCENIGEPPSILSPGPDWECVPTMTSP
jgi:hypothetical protein